MQHTAPRRHLYVLLKNIVFSSLILDILHQQCHCMIGTNKSANGIFRFHYLNNMVAVSKIGPIIIHSNI